MSYCSALSLWEIELQDMFVGGPVTWEKSGGPGKAALSVPVRLRNTVTGMYLRWLPVRHFSSPRLFSMGRILLSPSNRLAAAAMLLNHRC